VPKVRESLSFEVLIAVHIHIKGQDSLSNYQRRDGSHGWYRVYGVWDLSTGSRASEVPPIVTSVYRVSKVGIAVGVLGVFFEWGATLCGAVRVGARSRAEA
jgi:hypothetical protein